MNSNNTMRQAEKDVENIAAERARWNDVSNLQKIVNDLDSMARSAGYLIIRDLIRKDTIEEIRKDNDLYHVFQEIRSECVKSYNYDHGNAKIMDVNGACTVLYGTILKVLRASNNIAAQELDRVHAAINRIEEKLDIDKTDWTTEVVEDGNVEGDKKCD